MNTPKHTIGDVTFYGTAAEAAAKITNEEWAYYEMMDKLSDMLHEYMEQHGISKADLARNMGKSRAFVSKVLAGDAHNMTFKTFSSILYNTDSRLEFTIVPKSTNIQWLGVVKNVQHNDAKLWRGTPSMQQSAGVCGILDAQDKTPEKDLIAA